MKHVLSVGLFSLLLAFSTETLGKSQTSEAQKQKDQNPRTAAALSSPGTTENHTGSREVTSNDAEAQKRYDSAMSLSDSGRLDEAIEAFKQSLKLKPEEAQTHYSLGMTYSKAKDYKEAFESFRKAVRYKPEWAEAHFRLGVMSYVLGKKNQSTEEYKKLLEINSPLASVLYRIIKENSPASGIVENVAAADPNAVAPLKEGQTNGASPENSTSSTSENAKEKTTPIETTSATAKTSSAPQPSSASLNLTEIYRVGIGDILDVRFLNSASAGRSTLFTVVGGGVIDLPIAGGPIQVAGLTTDEIQTAIAAELKRRAVAENSQISVGVRQFVSHSVVVNGLVAAPGTRILRREAVPLYVILAESQLRNDAGRVTIMRGGLAGQPLDLADPQTLNVTVIDGDVINVTGRPQEFYYIAGKINYPGQKNFLSGITLLQAILAAGGTRQNENLVEISREGVDGRLVTTRFNLKQIKTGEIGDPKLQPGDRIEVVK